MRLSEPSRLDGHVVVHKSQNLAARLANGSIARIGKPLLRFEDVPYAARMTSRKLVYHIARTISRVVVNNEKLPFNFGRESRCQHAL